MNREINYHDVKLGIHFIENPQDPPDGYHVHLRRQYSFRLENGWMHYLARPNVSTEGLIKVLQEKDFGLPRRLEKMKLSPEQLHIAILKLALLRTESDRDDLLKLSC